MPIEGDIAAHGLTFHYGETSFGKGRGIRIFRKGWADDSCTYMIKPDPHDSRWYNKNQEQFYYVVADQLANAVGNRDWPAAQAVTVDDMDYELQVR